MIIRIIQLELTGHTVSEIAFVLSVSAAWVAQVQGTDGYKAQLALARGEVPPDSYVGR